MHFRLPQCLLRRFKFHNSRQIRTNQNFWIWINDFCGHRWKQCIIRSGLQGYFVALVGWLPLPTSLLWTSTQQRTWIPLVVPLPVQIKRQIPSQAKLILWHSLKLFYASYYGTIRYFHTGWWHFKPSISLCSPSPHSHGRLWGLGVVLIRKNKKKIPFAPIL